MEQIQEQDQEYGGQRFDKKGASVGRYQRDEKPANHYSLYETHSQNFMAVKPWLGAIVEPSNPPTVDQSPPEQNLHLKHVYGYRASDSRQNCYYTAQNHEIVYMTAALGIILDTKKNTQKFLGGGETTSIKGHDDDITALEISLDKSKLITGSVGKNPLICVWNLVDYSLLFQFNQGKNTRVVKGLGISYDMKYIASVAADEENTVFVFNAEDGTQLASLKSGPNPVSDLRFSKNSYDFGIVGKRGVQFFNFDGTELTQHKGLFNGHNMADMWSIDWTPSGSCVTGSTEGMIYFWNDRSCTNSVKVHSGALTAVTVTESLIVTGGKDNRVVVFDHELNQQSEVSLQSYAKSLDVDQATGNILAGLRDGTIVQIEENTPKILMESHSDGEVWGLAIDPNNGHIVTTADDNKILSYDPKKRVCIARGTINQVAGHKPKTGGASTLSSFPPNQCARSIDVNIGNGHVAFGCSDGTVMVRASSLNLDESVAELKHSKEWIEAIRYSPCGNFLAVGSHDNNICVYDTSNYNLLSKFDKQTAFITGLDWSTDSKYIQSVSGSYELLFSDANDGSQITEGASLLKDEQWASWSCKLGWPVQGIFPEATNGSFINGVARSNKFDLLATGDDWRHVNIHRYPALDGVIPKSFVAHSEFVVRVVFDKSDTYLYSIGGFDRTLIQWKVGGASAHEGAEGGIEEVRGKNNATNEGTEGEAKPKEVPVARTGCCNIF